MLNGGLAGVNDNRFGEEPIADAFDECPEARVAEHCRLDDGLQVNTGHDGPLIGQSKGATQDPPEGVKSVLVADGGELEATFARQLSKRAGLEDTHVPARRVPVFPGQRPAGLLGQRGRCAHSEVAAGLQDAHELGHGPARIGHVFDNLGADDVVEGVVREGQAIAVGEEEVCMAEIATITLRFQPALAAPNQLAAVEVDRDDAMTDVAQVVGMASLTATEVENAVASFEAEKLEVDGEDVSALQGSELGHTPGAGVGRRTRRGRCPARYPGRDGPC
jgi:hypothetical protein